VSPPGGSFEILEHTADVGVEATGETCEEAFEAAARGVATLLGAWFPGEGEDHDVLIAAADREALLVGWLDEILFLHESQDVVFGGFQVHELGDSELKGTVRAAPKGSRDLEGTAIKAATFHRLRVARQEDGVCMARVYLDV
jgi:SHS2 domain-containing protein